MDATVQGGEPDPCGVGISGTVWYLVEGDGGPVTIQTRGSDLDTVLAVYDTDGSTDPTDANALDCNNDIWEGGTLEDDRASEVVFFDSLPGEGYLVQVGSPSGDTDDIRIEAYLASTHDERATPVALPAGQPLSSDNVGATVEAGERTDCGPGADDRYGKTVWFRFTAPGPGTAVFSASGSFFDPVLAVYRASGEHLGCNDDGVPGQFGPSRLAIPVGGGDHLVQVGGWGDDIRADFGAFTVQVEFTPAPPPDRDGDGIADAVDRCPDQNSRARDANGDGCLDPIPPTLIASTVSTDWAVFARFTRVRRLRANNVPAGATVKVSCRARPQRRCPYRSRTTRVQTARRTLSLHRPYRGRRLPVGTVVTVQITAPGTIGKVIRYRIRRNALPRPQRLCLQPGASRPGACP